VADELQGSKKQALPRHQDQDKGFIQHLLVLREILCHHLPTTPPRGLDWSRPIVPLHLGILEGLDLIPGQRNSKQ
jgi:hypothetical protein